MRAPNPYQVAFAAALVVAACTADEPLRSGTTPTGTVDIEVAALSLDGIQDACWRATVSNGAGPAQTVWTRTLSSSQYGDGAGSASYVGACDASPGIDANTVSLELLGIYTSPVADCDAAGPGEPFQDPGVLTQRVTCRANEDARVTFNVAVLRPATQGFFDIAVNFEDIFCSAKLDTCYDVGPVRATVATNSALAGYRYTLSDANYVGVWRGTADADWDLYAQANGNTIGSFKGGAADAPPSAPRVGDFTYTLSTNPGTAINLLHGPGDVGRQHTAVAALACTAGPDAQGTTLMFTEPTITCGTGGGATTITLDLADGDGADGGNGEVTITGDQKLRYALYFGQEQLNCGVDQENNDAPISCNKIYYNIALNIGHLASQGYRDCTFLMGATAVDTADVTSSDPTFVDGELADRNAVYPGVAYNAITIIGGDGPICTANPLNGTGSGVQTMYVKGANYSGATGQPYVGAFATTGGRATAIGASEQ